MSSSGIKRFPIKSEPGRVILLEIDKIYYIQAQGDDSLVRSARKKVYKHVEPLDEVETRLPSPPFFRIHRSCFVNMDWDLEMCIGSYQSSFDFGRYKKQQYYRRLHPTPAFTVTLAS